MSGPQASIQYQATLQPTLALPRIPTPVHPWREHRKGNHLILFHAPAVSPGEYLTEHTSRLLGYDAPVKLLSVQKIRGTRAYVTITSTKLPERSRHVVIGRYEVAQGIEPTRGLWNQMIEAWEGLFLECFINRQERRNLDQDEWN